MLICVLNAFQDVSFCLFFSKNGTDITDLINNGSQMFTVGFVARHVLILKKRQMTNAFIHAIRPNLVIGHFCHFFQIIFST